MDVQRRRVIEFFRDHAGYATPPGRLVCAKRLADAEAHAMREGWEFSWESDHLGELGDHDLWCGRGEKCRGHEIVGCILRDEFGEHLASLWGIIDPDPHYIRVVEAELASEAMGDR